jgi:hypothetical protein
MTPNDPQFDDLTRLAFDRCEAALGSVTQLMIGPKAYQLLILVACYIIESACHLMQDGVEKQSGERPDYANVKYHAIGDVLTGLGIEWKPSRSQTKSAEK